jgi:hypothetical protein
VSMMWLSWANNSSNHLACDSSAISPAYFQNWGYD